MANAIEYILGATWRGGPAIQQATRQLTGITGALGKMGPAAQAALSPLTSMAGGLGQIGAAAGPIGIAAAALVGLGTAGFMAAKSLSDTYERLQNLSAATGAAVPDLQTFQQFFKDAGMDADSATQSLVFLNRAIGSQSPMLKQLAAATGDARFQSQELMTVLMAVSNVFAGSADNAKKTAIATELFGRGSRDLLSVIDQLAVRFPQMQSELRGMGVLIEGDLARQLSAFDTQMDTFAKHWEGWRTRIGGHAAGMANDIIKAFSTSKFEGVLRLMGLFAATTPLGLIRPPGVKAREAPAVEGIEIFAKRTDALAAIKTGLVAEAAKKLAEQTDAIVRSVTSLKNNQHVIAEMAVGLRIAATQGAGPLRVEVERLLAKFKDPELVKAAADFAAKIKTVAEMTEDLNKKIDERKPLMPKVGEPVAQPPTAPSEYGKVISEVMNARDAMIALLSAPEVVRSGLQATFAGLQSGFQTVAANLLTTGQTLRSALSTIFRSLVNEVLAELARLAAAKLFKLLISLLPGGGPASVITEAVGAGASLRQARGPEGGGGTIINNYVNALDLRSFFESAVSPGGGQRQANLRFAELAAVA